MDWDAMGAIGEVVGAVAVIVTIGYLAAQVRIANRRSASDLQSKISDNSSEICDLILNNPEVVQLLEKCKRNSRDFTDEEIIRAEFLSERIMNMWWTAEISYQNGSIDSAIYETMVEDGSRYMGTYPGLRDFCKGVLDHFSEAREYRIYDAVYERDDPATST